MMEGGLAAAQFCYMPCERRALIAASAEASASWICNDGSRRCGYRVNCMTMSRYPTMIGTVDSSLVSGDDFVSYCNLVSTKARKGSCCDVRPNVTVPY